MSVFVDSARKNRRRLFWVFAVIFMLAASLRVSFAVRHCLWVDELFSLAIATGHSLEHPAAAARPELGDFVEAERALPAEEWCRYLRHDNPPAGLARVLRAILLSDTSPPLYYVCLYYWTRCFGTSDLALRLFSTSCSLACFPLVAGISNQLAGRRASVAALALFAFSPIGMFYSTEGRMYALLWLCVLGLIAASLRLHRRGGTIPAVLWVIASAAGFLTHYFFVFVWCAIVAVLLSTSGRLSKRTLLLCVLGTGLLILPWYMNLPRSLHGWRITQDWLHVKPHGFHRVKMMIALAAQTFCGYEKDLWPGSRLGGIISLILVSAAVGIMIWRLGRRIFNWRMTLIWLSFAAACLGPVVFDFMMHTYTIAVPRYAIAGLPSACLLGGIALACLRTRARYIFLAVILLSWLPNIYLLYRAPSRNYSALCDVTTVVNADARPSDLILVHSIPSGVIGVAHYSKKGAAIASWVGQLETHRVPESLLSLADGRQRILFVKFHEVGEPAPEESWLRQHANVVKELRMRATLVEFRPMNAATFEAEKTRTF